jgi:hypothetical protein
MKYLNHRSLAVAARFGVLLRSDYRALPAFPRIYHFHVAHPKRGAQQNGSSSHDTINAIYSARRSQVREGRQVWPTDLRRQFRVRPSFSAGTVSVSSRPSSRVARSRKLPSSKTHLDSRVGFDSEASAVATLVEVVGQHRPGQLYDLASAFSEAGCNIDVVLIDTEVHKALDVFYVAANGRKLDPVVQARLRERLVSVCAA